MANDRADGKAPRFIDSEKDFLQEEYKSLRSEMLEQIKETYAIEKYIASACIGLTGYLLFTHVDDNKNAIHGIIWILPFFIAVLGFFRSLGLWIRMGGIARHLRRTEEAFTYAGWEQALRGSDRRWFKLSFAIKPGWWESNFPTVVSVFLWIGLLVVTGWFAWVYYK